MPREVLGHRFDTRLIIQIQGNPAGLLQRLAIELQPAWRAAARQPAIGHGDVGLSACLNERCQSILVERVASSRYSRPSR